MRGDVDLVGILPDGHALLVHVGHDGVGTHVDAEPLERAARRHAQRLGKRPEHVRTAFEQDDARRLRLNAAEVGSQRLPRDLRERARHLHAGRSGADDDERQQPPLLVRIRCALRRLEGHQDPLPDPERVVERFQAGRVLRPLVAAEVRMRRPAREDEVVERDRLVVVDDEAMPRRVDRLHVGEQDLDVFLMPEDPPDRRRHVSRRQRGGRDLIQQRLKQMVVVPIEQRDFQRRALRTPAPANNPAESATDNHDARPGRSATTLRRPQRSGGANQPVMLPSSARNGTVTPCG